MNSVRKKAKKLPTKSTIKSFNNQNFQGRGFQELNELDRFGRMLGNPIEKYLAPFKNLLEVFLIVLKFIVFIGAGMDKAKVNNTVNLIYGITSAQLFSKHDRKSDLFVQFLEQDRLGLTNIKQGKILIEVRESKFLKSYHQERVSVGSRIEDLIYFELYGFSTRFRKILQIILRSIRLMFSPIKVYEYRFSFFQYLVSDVMFDERLENRINLLITTQSQLLTQPYPFHIVSKELSGKKVMLWYSTNHGRISKDAPPWELDYDSKLSCMQIDRNLVWNQSEVNRLRKFGVRAEAVGSILFKPKPNLESEVSNYQDSKGVCQRSEHNLIIFDVRPRFDTSDARLYSYKNVGIFIADVLKAVHFSTLKIDCHVKPKREFSIKSELSDEYGNMIEQLEREGKLSVLNPALNLYDLVDHYCMAISIPYTSAGYVFYEAGRQACFYTPYQLQDLLDLNFQDEIENLIGIKSLIDWLSKHGL